jgi:hypothetical protein
MFNRKGEPVMQRITALSTALVFAALLFLIAIPANAPVTAGQAIPNVAGKWEGTWTARQGSGPITLNLRQDGNKVTGTQSVVGVIPLFGEAPRQMVIGQDVREGEIDDSTLHFHVVAENVQGYLNFTLTISGDSMTGTACGWNCAKLKLKKAPM